MRWKAVLLAASLGALLGSAALAQTPLGQSRQLLLVLTDDWSSADGWLQRFERTAKSAWKPAGAPVPVVVGRNGLAWGRERQSSTGPTKRERDGKSPAGIYRLGVAFGQSKRKLDRMRMPYRFLADNVECVDDVRSGHYNRLVTQQQVGQPDWTSSEKMWREPLYKWGVVVEYNASRPERGAGSCIFLHAWSGPGKGTAGCTAMAESNLVEIMQWLDSRKQPVLVQLPRAEYEQLKTEWKLP
ncbi:MAG: L,D-transpeptidase [Terriglobales bacterium]